METTTDAPSFARSRRPQRQADPAEIWGPLPSLTDAAVAAAGSGTVAINRAFDRNSRQRGKALRDLLDERGVTAVEVTAASGAELPATESPITAVVNLTGAGSWQPYRLAAKAQAPVLTPKPVDGPADEVSRNVIAMAAEDGRRDVALSHVALRSECPAESTLTVEHDGEALSVPGGWVSLTVTDEGLRIEVGGTGEEPRTLTTRQARVEAFGARHLLVRDELPIADFEDRSLTLTAEAGGLVVRPV
ncbi:MULTISPECIES: hypothetical protein [Saccharopolyspora]|uniref:Uncharacterized protein n=1 Tax=Saccharopolyspora cebuensis TaxID=418759 RepID=A0ABV4CG86_9PSEU